MGTYAFSEALYGVLVDAVVVDACYHYLCTYARLIPSMGDVLRDVSRLGTCLLRVFTFARMYCDCIFMCQDMYLLASLLSMLLLSMIANREATMVAQSNSPHTL